MLRKLFSLVGGLIAAPLGAGCTRNDPAGRTFTVRIPMTEEQIRELTGKPNLVGMGAVVEWEDPIVFRRIDETVDAMGYMTVTTSETGPAVAGKFAMRATLRKGDTGGPPGSATELFVEADDTARLVGRLSLPKAPPGARAILPGQVVVRRIPEGELARLDDRYVIELPARSTAELSFGPQVDDRPYVLSVSRNGSAIPLRFNKITYAREFETTEAGVYEFRVRAAVGDPKEPDSYRFDIIWGDGLTEGGDLTRHRPAWRTSPSSADSPTSESKR